MSNINVNALAASLKLGDVSGGNYTEIATDGSRTSVGDATCWDDLVGSLAARKLENTTGKIDYDWDENALKFQSGGSISTRVDRLIFNYQKPHGAKESSELRLHIHFEQTSTNKIVFTTQYRIQENLGTKTTAWTTVTANSDDDCVGTYTSGTINQIMKLVAVDWSAVGISSTVEFRLARTDSTTGDILGTFVDAHVEYDCDGSKQEYVK